ncbi:MAG TPA: hypothetical protein VMT14_04475 [Burkholderiaceae bacterium]|nr:hypothetical protein [Burkholderiaceae bacterium]
MSKLIKPRRWFAATLCALLVLLLLWGFVAVLQQGVERGDRMRAEQLQAATQPTAAKVRVAPVKTAKADARTQP